MYKILTVADTHNCFDSFYKKQFEELELKLKGLSAVFLLGDISPEDIKALLYLTGDTPIYGIKGNHDNLGTFTGLPVIDVSNNPKFITGTDITINGILGSSRYKSFEDQPFAWTQEESLALAEEMLPTDILICHDGPFGCFNKFEGSHSGLKGISTFIEKNKPKSVFFGHHHSNFTCETAGITCYGTWGLNIFNLDEFGSVTDHEPIVSDGLFKRNFFV